MIKLLWYLALLMALAAGFAWLADRPGSVQIQWLGRDIEMSVLVGLATLAALAVMLGLGSQFIRRLWRSPSTAREFWRFRKHRKAYAALSKGIIAAGAGDAQAAAKHAAIAGNTLRDEPLVNVLAAQAAQLKGDRSGVKRAFELMAKSPETEVLGLRGLFAEARQAGDLAAAIQHAEKALALNPRLAWASTAMLQIQSARKDWRAAAATLAAQGKSGLLARAEAIRKRASLLAAEALKLEDLNRDQALVLALEAHHLDKGLVPAALVAARCHIAAAATRKATRILRDAWHINPHPDLATVMAHAKPADGPEARYERVRDLTGNLPDDVEGAFALARAAIAARRFDVARKVLDPHLAQTPQARICALMAEIVEADGDKGATREWLAKALRAPRDPMWVSDGVASPRWTPVSPVTGEIVACEWKPPFDLLPDDTVRETEAAVPPPAQIAETPHQVELARAPDDPGPDHHATAEDS
jgi:HemY protein